MKKPSLRVVALAVSVGLVAGLSGCCWVCKFCHQVIITSQPQSQTVPIGSNVTFSVVAVKGPPYTTNGLTYQWQFNGTLLSDNLYWSNFTGYGATTASITITNVQTNDVGFYRVLVSGSPTVTSDPASLQVIVPLVGGITVYGTPVAKSKSGTGCPGSYVGYVYYTNSNDHTCWAYTITAGSGSATDVQSTSTKVQYIGCNGDPGCGTGGTVSVPIPGQQLLSSSYQFYIYFRSTPLPTGSYGINLVNFQQ